MQSSVNISLDIRIIAHHQYLFSNSERALNPCALGIFYQLSYKCVLVILCCASFRVILVMTFSGYCSECSHTRITDQPQRLSFERIRLSRSTFFLTFESQYLREDRGLL